MIKKQNLNWYTLVEILVVIAIIWILALAISNFNFTRLNAKQLVSIELVKIENILSEVRDNSLVWRWVWTSLQVPTSWNIDISTVSSGSLNSYYFIPSSIPPIDYLNGLWTAPENTSIQNILCKSFIGQSESSNNVTLTFTGAEIDISAWCTHATRNYKILDIIYGQWTLTGSVSINTVTWVITSQ